ncbi:MAG: C39 family peptidase [Acetatifactor sp.]|nr:C39 family peptidase [Acetatifactor sp.]
MKRKIMFRLLAGITAFVMALGLGSISIKAEDITQTDEFLAIIEERRDEYFNDSVHMWEAEEKGISIEELLYQDALAAYPMRVRINQDAERNAGISLLDVGNNGQCLSTNVKLIQQTTDKNCGPTAALQVLYGMSRQGAVSGTTDAEKINTLMGDCKTDSSGTYVGNLVSCLNKYSINASYRCTEGRTMTQAQVQEKLETSLCYNIAPILHAKTQYLPYYGGHSSGHYIAVSEVDRTTGKVRLSDCNWSNKYFGVHVESIEKVYQSIAAESDRYLIYMSY